MIATAPVTARRSVAAPDGFDGRGLTIVAEQLAEWGGMERVLEALLAHFPASRLVAGAFRPPPGHEPGEFEQRLARRRDGSPAGAPGDHQADLVPLGGRRHHYLAPLYAWRMRSVPVPGARTVLSLGAMGWTAAARGPEGARRVAYLGGGQPLHTRAGDYRRAYPPALRPLILAAMPQLRAQHRRMLRQVDRLLTNSRASAEVLSRVAERDVDVVYPPTRTGFFTPADRDRAHYLAVARLRAHKRIDLVVEAFRRLGRPLVVVGAGPCLDSLRATAPPNVRFTGHVDSDEELRELYRGSRALVSASVEEFGLCLVEAQAAGIPVIAPAAGGSGEIVRDGENGVALHDLAPAAIARAVERLDRLDISPPACRRSAERFSEERFVAEMAARLAV